MYYCRNYCHETYMYVVHSACALCVIVLCVFSSKLYVGLTCYELMERVMCVMSTDSVLSRNQKNITTTAPRYFCKWDCDHLHTAWVDLLIGLSVNLAPPAECTGNYIHVHVHTHVYIYNTYSVMCSSPTCTRGGSIWVCLY